MATGQRISYTSSPSLSSLRTGRSGKMFFLHPFRIGRRAIKNSMNGVPHCGRPRKEGTEESVSGPGRRYPLAPLQGETGQSIFPGSRPGRLTEKAAGRCPHPHRLRDDESDGERREGRHAYARGSVPGFSCAGTGARRSASRSRFRQVRPSLQCGSSPAAAKRTAGPWCWRPFGRKATAGPTPFLPRLEGVACNRGARVRYDPFSWHSLPER